MKNLTDFHKTGNQYGSAPVCLTTAMRTATEITQTGYSTGYSFVSLGIFMRQGCRTQSNKITWRFFGVFRTI